MHVFALILRRCLVTTAYVMYVARSLLITIPADTIVCLLSELVILSYGLPASSVLGHWLFDTVTLLLGDRYSIIGLQVETQG